ncbi:MAG: zf-HC2 domain-containing protein [Alicyclobacillus herbarius]|uniref:zf-HC2 domain-containing protein n=1 Tax=Alicyclobacillus herbarius TaxID=122960 RepID=UPI002352DAA3|nr:zf-HC2 domain-containing protein [Alicyclobacillus herbarius]MCL6633294.1 zf-HC2 domain-containing protein [Alicyclobacillus herbarius]
MAPVVNVCSLAVRYVLDDLNEFDRKRFERHLPSCPRCQQECRECREVLEWVRADGTDWLQAKSARLRSRWRLRLSAAPLAVTAAIAVLLLPHWLHHSLRLKTDFPADVHSEVARSATHLARVRSVAGSDLRHFDEDTRLVVHSAQMTLAKPGRML